MNKRKVFRDWKVGDDIYIKGKVREIRNQDDYPVRVRLVGAEVITTFTKDGRYTISSKIPCASFLPTEQSMPFDLEEVAVDTPVWVRHNNNELWEYRFFSHFEDVLVRTFNNQRKSKDGAGTCSWEFYSFENPFE